MSISTIAMIGIGGAAGAVMRHGVNVGSASFFGTAYPLGTLIVNIAGSFVMGLLISIFAHLWQPSPEIKLFLITGFLGAFTTFSSFSLDFVNLWERGDLLGALSYALFSVVFSITALALGMLAIRWVAL
ncbi:MAG: fluoride efflux transporter CrcB [Alphaproteobacteria bacterium]